MGGTGNDEQLFLAGASVVVFAAHAAGHKVVRAAVDEENRNLALRHGLAAIHGIGVKAAEDLGTSFADGIARPHRHVRQVLGQTGAADVPDAGVAAICDDAVNAVRKVQPAGQQNGGCAHRDAH